MAEPPELWAFVFANTVLFVFSSLLAVLSYVAYRQSDGQQSYLTAVLGFTAVVLGGLIEPTYLLGVKSGYDLTGVEVLLLQTSESALIAAGLALLFFAIVRHRSGRSPGEDVRTTADDRLYEFDHRRFDD